MNRIIKFRGKRIDNGEWVYVDLAHWNDGVSQIMEKEKLPDDSFMLNLHEIIPETVGQFTGLLDENGKEIYEGDIVDYHNGYMGENCFHQYLEVKYLPGRFVIYVPTFENKNKWGDCRFDIVLDNKTYEIRTMRDKDWYVNKGNIFDNPKLLEVIHNELNSHILYKDELKYIGY